MWNEQQTSGDYSPVQHRVTSGIELMTSEGQPRNFCCRSGSEEEEAISDNF